MVSSSTRRSLGCSRKTLDMGDGKMPCKPACPSYVTPLIFLLIIYFYFVALLYTFRPGWLQKANVAPDVQSQANDLDILLTFLYALLFTVLFVVAMFMFVRCGKC